MKWFIVVLSLVAFSESRVVLGYSFGSTTSYPSFTTVGRRGTVGQLEFNNQVNRYSVPYQSQHVQQYGATPVQTLVQQILGQNGIQQQSTPLVVYQQSGYGLTVPQTQLAYLNQNQDTTQLLGLVQQVLEENNVQRQLQAQQQQQQIQSGLGQLFEQSPVQALIHEILVQNGVGQQVAGVSTVGASGQLIIPQTELVQLVQQVLEQNGIQSGVQQVFGSNVGILTQLVNAIQNSQESGQNLNVLGGYPAGQGQEVLALLQQVLGQQVGQTTSTYNQVLVRQNTVGQEGVIYPVNNVYAY